MVVSIGWFQIFTGKMGCFTKHPFKTGCLGFQVPRNEMRVSRSYGCLKFFDQPSKEFPRLGHSGLLRRVPQACPPGSSSWSDQGGGGNLDVFVEKDGPLLAINGVITPITLLRTAGGQLWKSQSNFQFESLVHRCLTIRSRLCRSKCPSAAAMFLSSQSVKPVSWRNLILFPRRRQDHGNQSCGEGAFPA